MNVRQQIGINLRKMRLAKHMSQEALADECGLSRSYITAIEGGGRNVSVDVLDAIARVLGAQITTFFDGYSTRRSK